MTTRRNLDAISSEKEPLQGGCHCDCAAYRICSFNMQKVSVDEQDVAEAISDKERADILPSVMPIFKVGHRQCQK